MEWNQRVAALGVACFAIVMALRSGADAPHLDRVVYAAKGAFQLLQRALPNPSFEFLTCDGDTKVVARRGAAVSAVVFVVFREKDVELMDEGRAL